MRNNKRINEFISFFIYNFFGKCWYINLTWYSKVSYIKSTPFLSRFQKFPNEFQNFQMNFRLTEVYLNLTQSSFETQSTHACTLL